MSNDPIKKVLIHAPNWVGDHVMAFGFYWLARKLFSDAEVFLIGRAWVSSLLPEELGFNLIVLKNKKPSAEDLQLLKEKQFDLAITLSPSFRSALLLKKTRALFRLGYATDNRSWLLKLPVKKKKFPKVSVYEHRALSYMRLLTPYLGRNQLAETLFNESLQKKWAFHFKKSEIKRIEELLIKHKVKKNNYWVVCPGTVAPSKVYPIEHLAQVIDTFFAQNSNQKVVLVGTHIEKPYAQILRERVKDKKRLVDLTEQTSLKDLLFILRHAKAAIANDSGVAHLTYLTQTPLVTFIGMAIREETLTLNNHSIVLDKNLECAGCKKQICPRKDFPMQCLLTISPEEVTEAMARLIKQSKKN